ncbi:MAG TPA: IS1595 family transposase [Rhizomicrobium sp.]|jgi:transposase-like protein|nr:IS1595 family transposase [Rhizomicrobium sp.]
MAAKIPARFTNEQAARKHLEALLWPQGPNCPHCGVVNEATALKGKSTRPGVYWCNACQKPFSVTVGTVMERSKIPLQTWLYANHLICSSKKGISSHQLARMLGLSYKSAWFLAHRIREAMTPKTGSEPPLGGDGFIVEADETYVGKKDGKRKAPGAGGAGHKRTVLSLVERGGKIRSFKLGSPSKHEIVAAIRANVDSASTLHTDGAQAYKFTGAVAAHESVDHKNEYVRTTEAGDKVHTNTLEGFFSVFKRGMVGTYQHCGEQHLQRYLNEFDFRANNRIALGCDDAVRADRALQGVAGKRLTYRRTSSASHA